MNPSRKRGDRDAEFHDLINSPQIDMNTLRRMCTSGIVDGSGIRSICWRLLLNCLPPNKSDWEEALSRQRKEYQQFLTEIIFDPGMKRSQQQIPDKNSTSSECFDDHPLNPNPSSVWNTYFKENEVLLQIDKDVRRLCLDISFFQNATKYPCRELVSEDSRIENLRKRVERTVLNSETVTRHRLGINTLTTKRKQSSWEYHTLADGEEAHWEVVERILFVYAKLNPGTSYVQGMNEIIGPVYYTLASDPNQEWSEHAEADTFFCFTNFMADIRDNFIKSLDHTKSGITASMNRVVYLLREIDPPLWLKLEEQKIRPQYYLFRWITLLLSQEFPLPDVIYIWDILLAHNRRSDYLHCVCVSMITLLRERILSSDFGQNVKMLQNYPLDIDIRTIVMRAYEYYNDIGRKH